MTEQSLEAVELAEKIMEFAAEGGPSCARPRLLHQSMLERLLYENTATILSALRTPAPSAEPVAVLQYAHEMPGRENEMPRVLSCNWLPDGEYQVFSASPPSRTSEQVEAVARAIAERRAIRMVEEAGGDSTRIKSFSIDGIDREDAEAAIAALTPEQSS